MQQNERPSFSTGFDATLQQLPNFDTIHKHKTEAEIGGQWEEARLERWN
jgi:hypothetical protein